MKNLHEWILQMIFMKDLELHKINIYIIKCLKNTLFIYLNSSDLVIQIESNTINNHKEERSEICFNDE